ncbi:hypothetical protein QTN47_20160 [Danxiaibacter flavus]|uniref:Glycine cleavage system protein H n=1 Tax=Danxiaibacter flavus TaxID=3049108 RepID=A0ABV3ZIW8_9BACT|nr:hypothetical protein QNM32_20170 [Chitinophagaceae bacterium DXS]
MNFSNAVTGQHYFTQDHDWVEFKGAVADIGVSAFKLTGFKAIDKIEFANVSGFMQPGDLIASIYYKDYCIELRMPIAGKIAEINSLLLTEEASALLQSNGTCWIARIIPAQPYERKGLVLPEEYRMNGKSKYAKA